MLFGFSFLPVLPIFLFKRLLFRTLLHVCLVLLLALGVLWDCCWNFWWSLSPDTVNNVSKDVTKRLQGLRWTMPKTSQLKLENRCQIATLQKRPIKPMSLSILAKNGKIQEQPRREKKTSDDSKVLGTSDKNENFKAVKAKDRSKVFRRFRRRSQR